MRFTKSTLVVLSLVLAVTVFSILAFGKKAATTTDKNAVATITGMENASVEADTDGDSSFVEKNYVDNFSGWSSWGNWETKQSILADMKDNKTNSEVIADLKVLPCRTPGNMFLSVAWWVSKRAHTLRREIAIVRLNSKHFPHRSSDECTQAANTDKERVQDSIHSQLCVSW